MTETFIQKWIDYFLAPLLFLESLWNVCPRTCDVESGLIAVACVCNVAGDATEDSSIHLLHTCHLQNALWQQSVSTQQREQIFQSNCNFSVKASLVPLRSWSITCCPWCWATCGSSPRWCWPQELRWSHTGSERRHPPPLTWTLGGCGTLEELGNKSTTYIHGQIKRTILRIYTVKLLHEIHRFGHTCFFFDYFLHWRYTLKTSYIWPRYVD